MFYLTLYYDARKHKIKKKYNYITEGVFNGYTGQLHVSAFTGHLQVVLERNEGLFNGYTTQLHVSAFTGHVQVVFMRTSGPAVHTERARVAEIFKLWCFGACLLLG